MKRCTKCGKLKSESEFYKDKYQESGLRSRCKVCILEDNHKWHLKNLERHREMLRNNYYKNGGRSQEENKDCSNYLGCCINEQILKHVMPNAILMDNCNPGYDLICGKGYLVDAKSSTLLHNEHKNPYWHFNIRKNKIPDYFLLTAYKDRESLEILYMWLIPGKDINNRSGLSISEKCTSKWENYKIDHINAINYLHTIELPDGKV